MPPPADDDDKTIEVKQRPIAVTAVEVPSSAMAAAVPRRIPAWLVAVLVLAVLTTGVGFGLLQIMTPPSTPMIAPEPVAPAVQRQEAALAPPDPVVAEPALPEPARPEPVRPAPRQFEFAIETADEQRILDHAGQALAIFRFAANPRILVLDFASLREQGRMLNRVAALVEKAGLPRDRILTDPELDTAVRSGGDTVDTFYYGHDYDSAALLRFFSLADRDNIHLLDEEEMLRRLIRQDGWFEPGSRFGLITIPRAGSAPNVTRQVRATILHHELSHGEYFTNSEYAAFVHHFWSLVLTAAERDRIRRHLSSLSYDTSHEPLMENEAQAYLMFTYNAEFFAPGMIGMTKARLADLRGIFYRTMPSGWLRDGLGAFLNDSRAVPRKQ